MTMAWYEAAGFLIGSVVLLMALSMPVAFAFLVANVIGGLVFLGGTASLAQLVANAATSVSNFTLAPIPLFVIMGELFFHTGLAFRVFDALDKCLGRIRARLSYLTVAGGTIFAMLSGSSMANTAMMGSLMIPDMMRRGYKKHMAMGPILGTGGLAVIIPPSGLSVLLGSLAHIDIGGLLIGGVLPGLILAAIYAAMIWTMVRIDPEAAPSYAVERASFAETARAVVVNILPMGLVVFCVIGLIILGIATPTEAAAFGALSVFVLAIGFRVLTWQAIRKSLEGSLRVTAMTFFIIIGSSTFSQIMAFSGASSGMVSWATGIDVSPTVMLIVMFGILIVLGMFMDQVSMMMLTLPIFMPLAQSLQFDLVWFGLVMLMALEISFTTPPFGLLLFVMMGVAPKGTTLPEVALAALPYIAGAFLVVALIIMFPQIVLWLPSLVPS
jgi:tripartite ATP-independent transporter DctM subunit